jgi:hypothetical protein
MTQAQNPQYNSSGTIDLEYNHPVYGWIPFTSSPEDSEQLGRDLHAAALAGEFGEIQPYVEPEPLPPVVPSIVTMRQARLTLLATGLLPLVNSSIEALPSPQKEAAQIEWEYSQEVHRDKAFVQTLAAALGLTDEQLDNLFITASQL